MHFIIPFSYGSMCDSRLLALRNVHSVIAAQCNYEDGKDRGRVLSKLHVCSLILAFFFFAMVIVPFPADADMLNLNVRT